VPACYSGTVRERNLHVAIAAPYLARGNGACAKRRGQPADPLRGFFIRSGNDGVFSKPPFHREARHDFLGKEITSLGIPEDFGNGGNAMKMCVYRQYPVEKRRQKGRHRPLTDRLSFMEGLVLAHVTEIGRNEHEATRSVAAQRIDREQKIDQLFVRFVERAVKESRAGRGRNTDSALTVRKSMRLDQLRLQIESAREIDGMRPSVGE